MNQFDQTERKSTILVLVEDDETDIMFVQRCFRNYQKTYPDTKLALSIAHDGDEAIQLLRSLSDHPHVVLTDLNMPGMSGQELITNLRNENATVQTPIFVISSSRLSSDIQQAYEKSVTGYLCKQSSPDELARALNMIFNYCDLIYLP